MYKQAITKYIVLSLLVIYQVIALVHIANLPRLNNATEPASASSSIDFYHKNRSTSIPRGQFQRSFHSFEDARKSLTSPSRIFILFFAFFLTGLITLAKTKKPEGYLSVIQTYSSNTYLSLRTLRI
jgi:hypothetical protein